jgi:hypothetical protein
LQAMHTVLMSVNPLLNRPKDSGITCSRLNAVVGLFCVHQMHVEIESLADMTFRGS